MSDMAQGPGWWVASDGKWYPPELHPQHQPPPTPPEPAWIDVGARQAEKQAQRAAKKEAKRLADEEKAETKRRDSAERAERQRAEAEQRALDGTAALPEAPTSEPAPLDKKAAKAEQDKLETIEKAKRAMKARRDAGETPPPIPPRLPQPAAVGGAPLFTGTSRGEDGRNSTVTLWPDRIERVKARSLGSFSKANQDHEVTPVKSISSVQAKKDGFRTKVIVYATGNEIVFRLPHDDAVKFRGHLLDLMLTEKPARVPQVIVAQTPTATVAPSTADEVRDLAKLRDEGLMSDAEFETKRREILGL
jgi:hypothetical protein